MKELSGMTPSSVMTGDTGGTTGGARLLSQDTVLVVDNDPLVLELVSRSLSRENYKVVTTLRGDEGLRLARELRPAAILLDVVMPGMDGWTVHAGHDDIQKYGGRAQFSGQAQPFVAAQCGHDLIVLSRERTAHQFQHQWIIVHYKDGILTQQPRSTRCPTGVARHHGAGGHTR